MKMIAKYVSFLLCSLVFWMPSMLTAENMMMSNWIENETGFPYYSIYDGTTWTVPITITTSSAGNYNVYTALNPNNGTIVATWVENPTNRATYSIYNGFSWSPEAYLTSQPEVYSNVYIVYNDTLGQFMATWADSVENTPYYSLFNGTTWTSPLPIDANYSNANDVFTSVNTSTGNILATWADTSTDYLYYSIYNGTSWTTPAQLGDSTNTAYDSVFSVYDPSSDITIALWTYNSPFRPYYSIYNGSWSTPQPISTDPGDVAYDLVTGSYNADSQSIIASWNGSGLYYPMSSTFDGTTWSTPVNIGGGTSLDSYNVFSAYNPSLNETVATWGITPTTYNPYFTCYSSGSWDSAAPISNSSKASTDVTLTRMVPGSPVPPPGSLRGYQEVNDFALVYELFNFLHWAPSPIDGVTGYKVYRNNTLIATLPRSTLVYEDHNRPKGESTTYSVVAFDGAGNESLPVSFTVKPYKKERH